VLALSALGVVLAREVAAADGQDHGAVPLQQGGERGLIPAGPEAFWQPAAAVFRGGYGTGQGAEMTEDGSEWCVGHGSDSPDTLRSRPVCARVAGDRYGFFAAKMENPRNCP
jgi:hypothetical protein